MSTMPNKTTIMWISLLFFCRYKIRYLTDCPRKFIHFYMLVQDMHQGSKTLSHSEGWSQALQQLNPHYLYSL
jgi:hypothetical protein